MKTILVLTNLLFLSAAIYFGYQYYNPKPLPVNNTCVPSKDYTGTNVEGIPPRLALLEIKNYQDNLHAQKMGDSSSIDSRSVWFSLDSIKQFIWHLENEVCTNHVVNKDSLGIRFYLARYPNVDLWQRYDTDKSHLAKMKDYQNLATLFMVPTYLNNQTNVDFDPRSEFVKKDKNGKLVEMTIDEVLQKMEQQQTTGQAQMKVSNSNNKSMFTLVPSLNPIQIYASLIPHPPVSTTSGTLLPVDTTKVQ